MSNGFVSVLSVAYPSFLYIYFSLKSRILEDVVEPGLSRPTCRPLSRSVCEGNRDNTCIGGRCVCGWSTEKSEGLVVTCLQTFLSSTRWRSVR
jgi:hypothetical protein